MKLIPGMKSTFHTAVREAMGYRDYWHMPAKIWLTRLAGSFWFEAHPDTLHPGGRYSEILMELTHADLERLAEVDGTDQWEIEVNWLLDKAMARA